MTHERATAALPGCTRRLCIRLISDKPHSVILSEPDSDPAYQMVGTHPRIGANPGQVASRLPARPTSQYVGGAIRAFGRVLHGFIDPRATLDQIGALHGEPITC